MVFWFYSLSPSLKSRAVEDQEHGAVDAPVELDQVLQFHFFKFPRVDLHNCPGVFGKPGGVGIYGQQGLRPQPLVLRRGDVDVIEMAVGGPGEQGKGIDAQHFGGALQLRMFQVMANGLNGLAIDLDEASKFRSPAEGFDPHAAGAAKQIQEGGPFDIGADDVEEGFFGAVSDGPGGFTGHRTQVVTAGFSANDS